MALINTSTSGVTAASPPIQITIEPLASIGGQVLYTVPDGRKFVGRIFNSNIGYITYINKAYINAHVGSGANTPTAPALCEYTLLAGTVIKEGSGNTCIIGIESAA